MLRSQVEAGEAFVTRRRKPRRGTERLPEYLAWIRTLAYVVCHRRSGGFTRVEATHTNDLGTSGFRQKSSDFSAIPLCSGTTGEPRIHIRGWGRPVCGAAWLGDPGTRAKSPRHLLDEPQKRIGEDGELTGCARFTCEAIVIEVEQAGTSAASLGR